MSQNEEADEEERTLCTGEVEKWARVSGEPVWREWVKKMESKGRPEAQQILNTTLEMLKK